MESQPTIETAIEGSAPTTEIPKKEIPLSPVEGVTELKKTPVMEENSSKSMPDFLRILNSAFMGGTTQSSSTNAESEKTESTKKPNDNEEPSSSKDPPAENRVDLGDIMKTVMPFIPILAKMLVGSSDGEKVGQGPSYRSRRSKTNTLVLQIIISKWTFLITRSGKDEYRVSYRHDTTFQKKTMSSKGLYALLKTLTAVMYENIHFGLIFNNATLESRVLEPSETTKKSLKTHIRYFLCLL